jgi:CheY-like chemotaxis protein
VKRVLVVENDELMRDVTAFCLEDAGYQVNTAADGDAALALARGERPDAIVSDWCMGRMGGGQLMDACQESAELASVPFVIVSGSLDEISADGQQRGFAMVSKPFDLDDLVAAVADALQKAA